VRLFIVPAALDELRDAAAFYAASANVELGLAFVAEFERAANAVLTNPKIGARFRGTRRRYFLRRFPYSLFEEVAEILVSKFGARLQDLVPTPDSADFLYGDRIGSPYRIEKFRQEMRERRVNEGGT
jgi:plasmid stabilization system protein ParE